MFSPIVESWNSLTVLFRLKIWKPKSDMSQDPRFRHHRLFLKTVNIMHYSCVLYYRISNIMQPFDIKPSP